VEYCCRWGLLQIALGAVYAWRRRTAFVVMFSVASPALLDSSRVASVAALTFVSFVVLMRYGGGRHHAGLHRYYFGSKNVGPIYGLMVTVGASQRIWSPDHRAYATSRRQLPWRAPRDPVMVLVSIFTSAYRPPPRRSSLGICSK